MLNANPSSPNLGTREGEAYEAQFSTSDYGRVGDQRPYQIVFPSYPAPKFLSRYQYLADALRECDTLCQLKGQPFRLMKWGGPYPCYPCRASKVGKPLPSMRIHSPGALEGFPEATPVADFKPTGTRIVYGPDGSPKKSSAYRTSSSAGHRTPGPSSRSQRRCRNAMRKLFAPQLLSHRTQVETRFCAAASVATANKARPRWSRSYM